jgi:hypothetical protein
VAPVTTSGAGRGSRRQVYNNILQAALPPSGAEQNLAEVMREAAEMPSPSTEEGCQALRKIQELMAAAADGSQHRVVHPSRIANRHDA